MQNSTDVHQQVIQQNQQINPNKKALPNRGGRGGRNRNWKNKKQEAMQNMGPRKFQPQHSAVRIGTPPSHPQQLKTAGGVINVQQQQQQAQLVGFPQCASEVLSKVSEFVRNHGQNTNKGWNRVKVKELQNLIDNDLFCLTPDRRTSRLNELQYLRLLGIVCTYFQKEVSKEPDPQLRYLHFDIIFCGREGEVLLHSARIKFLIKVCSLATQFPCYCFFQHVAYWLSKVASDELKRNYAEQIITDLMEGFVLAPKENKLYEYLLPLVHHSFEFCTNFVIFSITDDSMGPILALIIGEWLASRIDQFLRHLAQCPHLSQLFCAEKFDLLLHYDCSAEAAALDDEDHHRLHCVLTEIPIRWKEGFELQRRQLAKVQEQSFNTPAVSNLQDAFQGIDSLPPMASRRLLENILCCIRAGFLNSMEPFRHSASLDAKYLAGPQGTLWQSLAVLARAQLKEG